MLRTTSVVVSVVVATAAAASPAPAQEADLDGIAYEKGSPDAPVVVVEYADFACSACGQFAREVWPELERRYIETGKVRWRFVLFELGFRNSDEAARAGHCGAELGDFWRLHDALFRAQHRWLEERKPKDALIAVAAEAGFDAGAFRACYDDNPGKDRTKKANRAARKDGVRATPTFFINGFRIQGALPRETFFELLEGAQATRDEARTEIVLVTFPSCCAPRGHGTLRPFR